MIRPVVVAFPRTMRAVPWRSTCAVAVLAAAPTVGTVLRGGHDLVLAFVAASVVGGAGLAYAVDDDAAAIAAASPTPLVQRRAGRVIAALLVVALGWGVAFAVGRSVELMNGVRFSDLAIEAVTAAGLAIAVAAGMDRKLLVDRTGLAGVATAVVSMLFITVMSTRYRWLPQLGGTEHHDRWLGLAAVGWLGVWWTSRDPAGRARARHRQ